MLVGATSSAYFLVHSESLESEFTNIREFRVNAGPVSSYIITDKREKHTTKYLKEVRIGSQVLAVDYKGNARRVTVNRNKIEHRPFVLISTKDYSILLQEAETVYLTTPNGKAVSVMNLSPGDEVLAYESLGGMHFGTQISEGIKEQ